MVKTVHWHSTIIVIINNKQMKESIVTIKKINNET